MFTWFFITGMKELIIENLILSEEAIWIAWGIIAFPLFLLMIFAGILFDIALIPLYILVGFITLVIKLIQIIFRFDRYR